MEHITFNVFVSAAALCGMTARNAINAISPATVIVNGIVAIVAVGVA